jgi:KaiC/GvpD/RAD55 family RecA-like ATPase
MSAQKALTGVQFFDERYGGTYAGRCTLLSGPAGSGKSAVGLQFVAQGVRQGERCLMLSAQPAADVVIYASAFGIQVQQAVDSGELIILEYADYVPGRDREENLMLPPDGFVQLHEIMDSNAVQRVVLDTALPWVMVSSSGLLAEHVFSFVRAFERLRCTTLLTMPKPVSPMASKLKSALDEVVPVSISISIEPESKQRLWTVTKYLGEPRVDPAVPIVLQPGVGAMRAPPPAPPPQPHARAFAPSLEPTGPAPVAPAEISAPVGPDGNQRPDGKVRFSDVLLASKASTERAPNRAFRFGMTIT